MSQGTSKTGRPSKKKNHKEIHKCTNRNVKLHFESFTLKHYLLLPMTYQNLSIQKATVVHQLVWADVITEEIADLK